MIVLFCFSSSLIVIISIPSLVCGSTKHDLTILLFIKKPISPACLSFLLSPIHLYPAILTFLFCFKFVSHKAIISQGLFNRICFREFTFDLIPLALKYITLISLSGMFLCFFLLLLVLFLFVVFISFSLYFLLTFVLAPVLFDDLQFELIGLLLSGLLGSFFVCYLLLVFYSSPECN